MYARFRTWLVSQIVLGASPREVARWCRTYRARFLATCPLGWADGLAEVPTETEIAVLEAMDDAWLDYDTILARRSGTRLPAYEP